MHPLTLSEIDKKFQASSLESLLKFGGFPEPYIKQSDVFYRRWKKERVQKLVYEDLRDLDTIKELSLIELLVDALPSRVGSVLSIKSLQEDLEVSPNTVSRWIAVLEAIYYCFRILPYGPPKIRAVKKSNKLYLWDWGEVHEIGPRFENLVASHLLKYCHLQEDTTGHKMELGFIRDIDLREIDFVVLKDKVPIFAVECKTGEKNLSKHIKYFSERTPIPHYYQVHLGTADYKDKNCRVLPFTTFCREVL
jgi:predicted AAA+ superfamily ATPase